MCVCVCVSKRVGGGGEKETEREREREREVRLTHAPTTMPSWRVEYRIAPNFRGTIFS